MDPKRAGRIWISNAEFSAFYIPLSIISHIFPQKKSFKSMFLSPKSEFNRKMGAAILRHPDSFGAPLGLLLLNASQGTMAFVLSAVICPQFLISGILAYQCVCKKKEDRQGCGDVQCSRIAIQWCRKLIYPLSVDLGVVGLCSGTM